MPKIDFYITHLVRHQAKDIVLSSGKPVLFGFPSGSRASNNALDHGQLQEIVRESAPNEALQTLLKEGATQYPYSGEIPVTVAVDTRGPSDWKVRISPGRSPTPGRGSTSGGGTRSPSSARGCSAACSHSPGRAGTSQARGSRTTQPCSGTTSPKTEVGARTEGRAQRG